MVGNEKQRRTLSETSNTVRAGMREALESARLDFHNGLDKLDRAIDKIQSSDGGTDGRATGAIGQRGLTGADLKCQPDRQEGETTLPAGIKPGPSEANSPAAPVGDLMSLIDDLVKAERRHAAQPRDTDALFARTRLYSQIELIVAGHDGRAAFEKAKRIVDSRAAAPVDAGVREALERCRSIAEDNKLHWAKLCDPCNPNDPSKAIYRAKSAACFQVEMDIAALQVEPVAADFESAWAKRPWIDGPESDKDRARRWWNAALSSQPVVRVDQKETHGTMPKPRQNI